MNQQTRWDRWHEMFDRERPIINEVVKLLMINKKIIVAVYNPRWENGFRVYGKNESVPSKPIAWRRHTNTPTISQQFGSSGNVDQELQAEVVSG